MIVVIIPAKVKNIMQNQKHFFQTKILSIILCSGLIIVEDGLFKNPDLI